MLTLNWNDNFFRENIFYGSDFYTFIMFFLWILISISQHFNQIYSLLITAKGISINRVCKKYSLPTLAFK